MKNQEKRSEIKKKIDRIEEDILENEREIRRLSEEIDDIFDIKRQSDSEYGEILEYWKGSPAYKRMYESNERRGNMLRKLIESREENLKDAKEKKKKLVATQEDLRYKYTTLEEA